MATTGSDFHRVHAGFIFTILAFVWCCSWIGCVYCAQINVNTADEATISRELWGIGLVKAEAIVQYRSAYGDFQRKEDLLKVRGIGPVLLERNWEFIHLKDVD